MDLVIATKNPAKFSRYSKVVEDVIKRIKNVNQGLRVRSLVGFEIVGAVDEPYLTAEENAKYKAIQYYDQLLVPVMAIDEALYLDFLSSETQPGVHPRRIIDRKTESSDEQLYHYWIDILKTVPKNIRSGVWRVAICIYGGEEFFEGVFEYKCEFVDNPGDNYVAGYPMSTLCLDSKHNKVYADLTEEERLESDLEIFGGFDNLIERFLVK